jgi:hypothetical protein
MTLLFNGNPTWWGTTGPHSIRSHLVQGPVGGTGTTATCGKRANPRTGWLRPDTVGKPCTRCLRQVARDAMRASVP